MTRLPSHSMGSATPLTHCRVSHGYMALVSLLTFRMTLGDQKYVIFRYKLGSELYRVACDHTGAILEILFQNNCNYQGQV